MCIAIGVGIVGGLIDIPLIGVRAPHLSGPQLALALNVSQIAWINVTCMMTVGLLGAVQVSGGRLIQPQIATFLTYIVALAALIELRDYLGVRTVAYAAFLGSVVAVLYLVFSSRHSWFGTARINYFFEGIRDYMRTVPHTTVAVTCFAIGPAIDAIWAPYLGEGEISFIGYCQRITVGVGTILIVGPSNLLARTLSQAAISAGRVEVLNALGKALRSVVLVSVPIAIFLGVLSKPVIAALFNYGSFDSRAVEGVARFLPYSMSGMVPMLAVVLCFRAFFALEEHRAAAGVSAVFTIVYLGLSFWLSRTFGFMGIGVAFLLSWVAAASISIFLLFQHCLARLQAILDIRFGLAVVVSSIAMFAVLKLASSLFLMEVSDAYVLLSITKLLCIATLGVIVYALAVLLICPAELRFLSHRITSENRSAPSKMRE
jgi:putative peptidoglycan lipid II flippase